jgi:uncharacterized membrane protein
LVFLVIDKRAYVRLHAAQSIVVFPGLQILQAALGAIIGMPLVVWRIWQLGSFYGCVLLLNLVGLLTLVLWIVLMVKAFQGIHFKLSLAGDVAGSLAGTERFEFQIQPEASRGKPLRLLVDTGASHLMPFASLCAALIGVRRKHREALRFSRKCLQVPAPILATG